MIVSSSSNVIFLIKDMVSVELFVGVVSFFTRLLQQPCSNIILSRLINYLIQFGCIPLFLQYYPNLIYPAAIILECFVN